MAREQGTKLKLPYADLLPPLSTEEREALKQSIKAEGVRDPVWVDEDGNLLDGYNRYGIDPDAPRRVLEGSKNWTDAQKKAWIWKVNFERRNLSPEQKTEADSTLGDIAKQLNQEGKKQKEIAEALGVRQQRVSEWLKVISDTEPGKANNCKPRDARVVVPKEEYESIAERVEAGESQAQVAADYGISQPRVSTIVREVERQRERQETETASREHENEAVGKRAAPPSVLAITKAPLILLSQKWFVPGGAQAALDELEEKGAWDLASRLDQAGAFVVFRTMGRDDALDRAFQLRDRWKLSPLGWYPTVRGMNRFGDNASEALVIAKIGNPEIPASLPSRESNDAHCPAAGIEALVLSWFQPFIEERGTENLVIEIGGTEKHKGYQLLSVEGLEAPA